MLHFNSYFAPQFRLNILYAPFQRASTRTNPELPPLCDTFMQHFAIHSSLYEAHRASSPRLLTVNFSKRFRPSL